MSELFFTPWHEWVRLEDDQALVGLTGIGLTGDVVFIELPEIGRKAEKGDVCASVETVKTVSEVHAPAAGIITEVNDTVFDDPDIISRQPLDTWLFRMDIDSSQLTDLLTERDYAGLRRMQ